MPQRTPITVNDQTFERGVLRGEGFILVTFWADWSGSWHMMEPVVEDVITMFNGKIILARCDVDDSRGTLERFGILSPPALLLFKGGELLDRISGSIAKDELFKRLNSHIQNNQAQRSPSEGGIIH